MSPLFAPVFAQLVSLGVGDRTEGRYLKAEDERFEAATSPGADLDLTWRHSEFSLTYVPTLTLTPIERKPRSLLIFHSATASGAYRWRRSRLELASSVGWGEVNFRVAALRGPSSPIAEDEPAPDAPADDAPAEPTPAGGAPGPAEPEPTDPATNQLRIVDRNVRHLTSTTALAGTHNLTREVTLGARGGYTFAGGLDDTARVDYPLTSAWFVGSGADHTYRLSARDAFTSSLAIDHVWSSNGNKAGTLVAKEVYRHAFDRRTFSSLGAGLSITRFSQQDGLRGFSVFPNFEAALAHQTLVGRGTLTLAVYSYSSPALDPLRALVDPRVGVGGSIGYALDSFSLQASGDAALSLAPRDADDGSIDSVSAGVTATYQLGDVVAIDCGGRYAARAFQDTTLIPPSWAAFCGLTFGYRFQLLGGRRGGPEQQ